MNQFVNQGFRSNRSPSPSPSPSIRRDLTFSPQFSPHQNKYVKQFKCLDNSRKQTKPDTFPVHKQSPSPSQKLIITTKLLRNEDKENNCHYSNISNIHKYPNTTTNRNGFNNILKLNTIKHTLNTSKQSSNKKQPTPQFEQKSSMHENNEQNQEFILSNDDLNIRYCQSDDNNDSNFLTNFNEQLQRITINNNLQSDLFDECSVRMESISKEPLKEDRETQVRAFESRNVAVQAFESTQFERGNEAQLEKLFGSYKKIKIICKKPLNTQQTQRTEADSTVLIHQLQQLQKTIGGLSNIDCVSEVLRTETNNEIDSHRLRIFTHEDQEMNSFRMYIPTPKYHHKKIGFLLYKKQMEREV